jgi:hypothetical protein
VGLFRKKETLNEKLLRQAGLDPSQALGDPHPAPELQPPSFGRFALPDGSRVDPREWDAAVAVRAPGLAGDRIEFTTIPSGDVIVSEESGDADLSALADAIERYVDPPYRALAVRQPVDMWAVAAKRIRVAQIPFPDGEKLELSQHGEDRELRVDGESSDAAAPPELERLGQAAGDSFYVEAERIDGDLWEIETTAL